jgi:hypothetical protein
LFNKRVTNAIYEKEMYNRFHQAIYFNNGNIWVGVDSEDGNGRLDFNLQYGTG